MKVINRGAITITYKKPFVEWNNRLFPDLPIFENMLGESKTYLVKDDFDDAEKVIKKHYKQIFELELESYWTDENDWPKNRDFKLFNEWFAYEISDWVVDLINKPLEGE
jgi:hypothetical protein